MLVGHYENWRPNAEVATYGLWYNARDLVVTVNNIRKIDFSKPEKREEALNMLNAVATVSPVAHSKRFPERGVWVSESYCWVSTFQWLRMALCYKEGANEVCTTCGSSARKPQNYENALQNFFDCTSSILTRISSQNSTFSRKNFEETYRLTWTEP